VYGMKFKILFTGTCITSWQRIR